MNRPPWEIFVVEGLDHVEGLPKGCYAIVTKIHHAAVDGASLMRFFSTLADSDALGTPLVPLEAPKIDTGNTPSMSTILSRALRNNLRSPVAIAESVMRAAPSLMQAAQDAVARREGARHPVPPTRFNVDLSPHKMFDARVFALEDLKKIRKVHPGLTINDVVLAICAGGLRRYLLAHDELPEESLIAWVPINARPRDADGEDIPGNNITAMTTPIFTEEADALTRLKRINQSTLASKEARSGISARLMTDITRHVPAATQVLASRLLLRSGAAARFCNLFISNVPGPQIPMYMNGARMVRSVGLAPLADGMGLFIGTQSYDGQMSFNVISTREVLPDIEFFMRCLEESLEELLALTRKKAAPKRSVGKSRAGRKTAAGARRKAAPKSGGEAVPGAKKKAARKAGPAKRAAGKAAARKRSTTAARAKAR
jgi:WS/DGAT/MGAT family acyltransferase